LLLCVHPWLSILASLRLREKPYFLASLSDAGGLTRNFFSNRMAVMKMKKILCMTVLIHFGFFYLWNSTAYGQRAMYELNMDNTPELFKDAVRAVIDELVKTEENPEEFYIQFPEKPANEPVIILNLWHKSAFDKINNGKAGNPGGKCRDIYYDIQQHKIIKVLFWQ
jgi:hypothetical protein